MYTEFYNLTRSPFENTPDPIFLYLSKQHKEVLSALLYGIRYAKGFVLVAGDVGTGKTTLIHVLLNSIRQTNFAIHVINPRIDFDDILKYLAAKIGITLEGLNTLELIDHIRRKLEHQYKIGRRAVLIIDEAHLLSEDSLEDIRLISNLESEKRKLIQIALVGQNEIYDTLQKGPLKSLKQRILINRKLKPLGQKDTRHYIRHRLNVAGTNTNLFDTGALSLIWRKSGGTPRIINHICDNALLIGFAEEKKTIGAKIIKEVVKDMETGYNQPRFHFRAPYFRLRWLVGSAAIVFTILVGLNLLLNQPSEIKEIFNISGFSVQEERPPQPDDIIGGAIETATTEVIKQKSANPHDSQGGRHPLDSNIATDPKNEKIQTDNNLVAVAEVGTSDLGVITERVTLKLPSLAMPNNHNITHDDFLNKKKKKVKPKEYLYRIATEEYGIVNDTVLDVIHMANPDINNLDLIFAGQIIRLPQISRKDLIVKGPSGRFYIHYASHYQFEDAQKTVLDLIGDNMKAFIIPSIQGSNSVYRVYCGFFYSRLEAEEKIETLELKRLPFVD